MWVSTPALGPDGKPNTSPGFMTVEVGNLNDKLLEDNYPKILTKPFKSGNSSKPGGDAGLNAAVAELIPQSGHNFGVIH